MSVKQRRLVIAGKHLNEREDGKRKEKMRCKTICEIVLCMGALCARGT